MFTFYSSVLRHLLRMVLEKISHWSWMNTVTYFPQDKEEFFLVSVTKHKQEFDTFICWVRIVKIVKNNQNTKMTRFTEFTRFKKFSWVSSDNHSLTNLLLATMSELGFFFGNLKRRNLTIFVHLWVVIQSDNSTQWHVCPS